MAAPAHVARENGKKGGRPKGTTTRPQLRNFFDEKEIESFVKDLKVRAKTDTKIAVFLAEQLFGKAVQPIGNDNGQPLIVQFDNSFKKGV